MFSYQWVRFEVCRPGDGHVSSHTLSEDDASVNFEAFQRLLHGEDLGSNQGLPTDQSNTGEPNTTSCICSDVISSRVSLMMRLYIDFFIFFYLGLRLKILNEELKLFISFLYFILQCDPHNPVSHHINTY